MTNEYARCLELAGIPNGPAYEIGPPCPGVVVEEGAGAASDISLVQTVRSVREIQAEVAADTARLTRTFISGEQARFTPHP